MARRYDVFISYARADNEMGVCDALALKTAVELALTEVGIDRPNVFVDREDLREVEEWWPSILQKLAASDVLLVALTPTYVTRPYCYREWDEFRARPGAPEAVAVLPLGTEDAVTLLDDAHFWAGSEGGAEWREDLRRSQELPNHGWESALARHVQRQRERRRDAGTHPSNVPAASLRFVGRAREIDQIQDSLAKPSQGGRGTVLFGPPGMGKTQVALEFAQRFRADFKGGTWIVDGTDANLDEALSRLVAAPELKIDRPVATLAGEGRVCALDALSRLISTKEADRALVILDHVTEPRLLDELTSGLSLPTWLRVLATTYVERSLVGGTQGWIRIGPLPENDGLRLVRRWQPLRGEQVTPSFASRTDEEIARRIVQELGGRPDAIERVAAFLGREDVALVDLAESLGSCDSGDIDHLTKRRAAATGAGLLEESLQATLDTFSDDDLRALQMASVLPSPRIPTWWLQDVLAKDPDPSRWADLLGRWHASGVLQANDGDALAFSPLLVKAAGRRVSGEERALLIEKIGEILLETADKSPASGAALWTATLEAALGLPTLPPGLNAAIDAQLPALVGLVPEKSLVAWAERRLRQVNSQFRDDPGDLAVRAEAIRLLYGAAVVGALSSPKKSLIHVEAGLRLATDGRVRRLGTSDVIPALLLLRARLLEHIDPVKARQAALNAGEGYEALSRRRFAGAARSAALAGLMVAVLGEQQGEPGWEWQAEQAEKSLRALEREDTEASARRDAAAAYYQLASVWAELEPDRARALAAEASEGFRVLCARERLPRSQRDLARSVVRQASLTADAPTAMALLREADSIHEGLGNAYGADHSWFMEQVLCAVELSLLVSAHPDLATNPAEEPLAALNRAKELLARTSGQEPRVHLLRARVLEAEGRTRIREDAAQEQTLRAARDLRQQATRPPNREASLLSLDLGGLLSPQSARTAFAEYEMARKLARPDSIELALALAKTAYTSARHPDLRLLGGASEQQRAMSAADLAWGVCLNHPRSPAAYLCVTQAQMLRSYVTPTSHQEGVTRFRKATESFIGASAAPGAELSSLARQLRTLSETLPKWPGREAWRLALARAAQMLEGAADRVAASPSATRRESER